MFRKSIISVLIVILIIGFAAGSFAAQDDGELGAQPSPQPTASANSGDLNTPDNSIITPNSNDALSISSDYIDPNLMQSSYAQGYAPIIADGNAIIVLPLNIDMSKIQPGSAIKTSVSLTGDPFVAKNFDTTLPYDQFQNGFYPFTYYLPLVWPRDNGTYSVPISITYQDTTGYNVTQTFDINVIITDGPQPTPEPTFTPEPIEGPVSQPKVILSNYIITPDPVYAGETFTAICTLKNTSEDMNVKNLTVIYRGQTTDLMPEDGANTSYIEKISPGASEQFTFKMQARADSVAGPQKISLDISYDDSKTNSYTVTDEITVQVRQHIRLTNDQPNFPTNAYIGDSIQASLNLYNKGKNTLYNVTVDLDVPGIYPESSAFLGNMESGSSKTADIYAIVGTDPTGGESVESGHYSGNFLVSYEDEYGEQSVMEVPVELDIMEIEDPGMWDPSFEDPDMEEPEENPGMPWWIWLIIAGGGAIAAVAIIANRRKKKRERELLEEMDDNDVS